MKRETIHYPTIIFFASLVSMIILAGVMGALNKSSEARWLLVGNMELFRGAFFMLTLFLTATVMMVVLQMGLMTLWQRALSFFGIVLVVGNQVLLFAIMYYALGLMESGSKIDPSMFQASYFSVLIFTGSGMAEFQPVAEGRDLVMLEAAMGFIFVPVIITAAFLLVEAKKAKMLRDVL